MSGTYSSLSVGGPPQGKTANVTIDNIVVEQDAIVDKLEEMIDAIKKKKQHEAQVYDDKAVVSAVDALSKTIANVKPVVNVKTPHLNVPPAQVEVNVPEPHFHAPDVNVEAPSVSVVVPSAPLWSLVFISILYLAFDVWKTGIFQ